ncbi:MAG: hypothetical protein U9R74_18655 [Pseudomonadota bacterium]|nr:hypothetical protein [Pseudomonadota bacterium]
MIINDRVHTTMRLPDLLREINTVAQTGDEPMRCESLARQIYSFADMVGWAEGPIDAQNGILNRLSALQDDLEGRFAQTNDPSIAALHDSLTALGRAIARHDEDLQAGDPDNDDGDDLW